MKLRVATNNIVLFNVCAGTSVYFNGLQVEHTNSADRANTIAFLADGGGRFILGGEMVVDGFYWNIFSRHSGTFWLQAGGVSKNAGDANVIIYVGGGGLLEGWSLLDADDVLSALGSGLVVEGGFGVVDGCIITGNKRAALHLISGFVRSDDTDYSDNLARGVLQQGGEIDFASACTAGGNGTFGYESANGSGGSALNLTNLTDGGDANGTLLYRPFVENYWDNQPGSRVVSPNTNESRRYDSKGTGSHFFNTAGVLQFEVEDVANAVNWATVRGGATGVAVRFGGEGETDVSVEVAAKAAGTVKLMAREVIVFEAVANSGANTFMRMRARSSDRPQLEVAGPAGDIDLGLVPQSNGVVRFGTFTAGAGETFAGTILVKDNATGTLRKLAVFA